MAHKVPLLAVFQQNHTNKPHGVHRIFLHWLLVDIIQPRIDKFSSDHWSQTRTGRVSTGVTGWECLVCVAFLALIYQYYLGRPRKVCLDYFRFNPEYTFARCTNLTLQTLKTLRWCFTISSSWEKCIRNRLHCNKWW